MNEAAVTQVALALIAAAVTVIVKWLDTRRRNYEPEPGDYEDQDQEQPSDRLADTE